MTGPGPVPHRHGTGGGGPRSASPTPEVIGRNHVVTLGPAGAPALVMAHGFGCDQTAWRHIAPWFTDDHRVVLFDHVGSGSSDTSCYDSAKYSGVDGYAHDLLEVCDALDLSDVVLIGHSISAMVVAAAAAAQPSRFAALVLVSPSPRYLDDPDEGYVGGFSAEDVEELMTSMDNNYFSWARMMAPVVMGADHPGLAEQLTGSFCRTDPRIAREFARVTFLSDSRRVLGSVSTPTLVLQCTDDALAPDAVGRYVVDHLPSGELVQLAATGHCPHISAPDETAQAIRRYLAARR